MMAESKEDIGATPGFRSACGRWLRRGLVFVCVFLLVGQALSLLVHHGVLWRVLASELRKREEFQVQDALFAAQDTTSADVLVLGDGLFLDSVQPMLPTGLTHLEFRIPVLNLRDIAAVLGQTRRFRPSAILIQDSPTLWSNYSPRSRGQNLDFWRRGQGRTWALLPYNDVGLLFQTLKLWAAPLPKRQAVHAYRLQNLDQLSFDAQPEDLPRLLKSMDEATFARVVWVADLRRFDRSSNPELVREFQQHQKTRETRMPGCRAISLDGQALRNVLGDLRATSSENRSWSVRPYHCGSEIAASGSEELPWMKLRFRRGQVALHQRRDLVNRLEVTETDLKKRGLGVEFLLHEQD